MATELLPGVMTRLVSKLALEIDVRAAVGLEAVAVAIEERAKLNASNGSHAYGTKTPASPGQGPAIISGTLRDSITHDPVSVGVGGLNTRVGLAGGTFPPYSSRTAASKYGYYLEVPGAGRSHVRYPFLKPAADMAALGAHMAFQAAFQSFGVL